jgi:hypothetical protein
MRFRAGGAERDYTSMSRAIHLVRCGPSFRWKRGVRSHGRRHVARSMQFARRGEGTNVCPIGPGLHGLALRLRRRTSQEPRTGPGYFTLSTQYSHDLFASVRLEQLQQGAKGLRLDIRPLTARSNDEMSDTFASMAPERPDGSSCRGTSRNASDGRLGVAASSSNLLNSKATSVRHSRATSSGTLTRNAFFWTKSGRWERFEPCCVERSNPRADILACARAAPSDHPVRHRNRWRGSTPGFANPVPGPPTPGGVLLLMRREQLSQQLRWAVEPAGVLLPTRRQGSRTPPATQQQRFPLLVGGVRLSVSPA